MTTPLIPIKNVLTATKYTPAELLADTTVETFLMAHTAFIRAMMTAYRAGNTSFSYTFPTSADALYAATTIGSDTAYAYTVTGPDAQASTITVSWA